MDFIEVVIYTTTKGIEPLTARLTMLSVSGFVIEDATDFENFLEDKTLHWDYVDESLMQLKQTESNIKIYVHNNNQGKELLDDIKKEVEILKKQDKNLEYGRLGIYLNNVKEEDWDQNWKQYFKPFFVGNRFVIKPSWEEYKEDNNRIILEIDPASSFGTGSHHTTQLCLEALQEVITGTEAVLDMGCGSGILGIGAMLLSAGSVLAVDIEENSTKTALENAQKNNVDKEKFKTLTGNILNNQKLKDKIGYNKYDVIVANIVADVIIAMAKDFKSFLKEGGILIVSGIITEREHEVEQALNLIGFKTVIKKEKGGWSQITLK